MLGPADIRDWLDEAPETARSDDAPAANHDERTPAPPSPSRLFPLHPLRPPSWSHVVADMVDWRRRWLRGPF